MAQFLQPPETVTGPVPRAENLPAAGESGKLPGVRCSLSEPSLLGEVIAPLRPFRIRPSSEEDPHAAPPSLFSRPALPAVLPCLILPRALNRDDHRFSRRLRAESRGDPASSLRTKRRESGEKGMPLTPSSPPW